MPPLLPVVKSPSSKLKNTIKPPHRQVAFTLLELIVVVVVLAILSSYVASRFSNSSSYKVDTVAEQIVAAGQLAQQLSMNDSQRSFALSIQSNQINLLADGATFMGTNEFPIVFDSSISISPSTTISFDGLGQTTAASLNITDGQTVSVCFIASGLIRRC